MYISVLLCSSFFFLFPFPLQVCMLLYFVPKNCINFSFFFALCQSHWFLYLIGSCLHFKSCSRSTLWRWLTEGPFFAFHWNLEGIINLFLFMNLFISGFHIYRIPAKLCPHQFSSVHLKYTVSYKTTLIFKWSGVIQFQGEVGFWKEHKVRNYVLEGRSKIQILQGSISQFCRDVRVNVSYLSLLEK